MKETRIYTTHDVPKHIALKFGSDTCQINVGIVQINTKSGRKMSDVRLLFHALHTGQVIIPG